VVFVDKKAKDAQKDAGRSVQGMTLSVINMKKLYLWFP